MNEVFESLSDVFEELRIDVGERRLEAGYCGAGCFATTGRLEQRNIDSIL